MRGSEAQAFLPLTRLCLIGFINSDPGIMRPLLVGIFLKAVGHGTPRRKRPSSLCFGTWWWQVRALPYLLSTLILLLLTSSRWLCLIICRHVHVWEYALLSQNPPYETHLRAPQSLVFGLQCMCVVCVSVWMCYPIHSSLFSFVEFDFRAPATMCSFAITNQTALSHWSKVSSHHVLSTYLFCCETTVTSRETYLLPKYSLLYTICGKTYCANL